ncbi:hypothetical protein, partial [Nocardioides sp.]|uniref:hypothetical protein n=1 Tax=Nocardioides sp. TaxID=35761 RepID=UPI0025FA42CC
MTPATSTSTVLHPGSSVETYLGEMGRRVGRPRLQDEAGLAGARDRSGHRGHGEPQRRPGVEVEAAQRQGRRRHPSQGVEEPVAVGHRDDGHRVAGAVRRDREPGDPCLAGGAT